MSFTRKFTLLAAAGALLAPIALSALPAHAATTYQKYSWSSAVYSVTNGDARQLSLQEWNDLGNPAPRTMGWIEGSRMLKYPSNPDELFLAEPSSKTARHHLTVAEYVATGHGPSVDADHSFAGYTWNDTILIFPHDGAGTHASLAMWLDLGAPTPKRQAANPGDQFCQTPADGAIFWSNTAAGVPERLHLTFDQYSRAGFPAFTVCS
ncbi:hypothetical protein C5B96_02810 [Subtercola sp. Z020]|uniref:hypothetical protein n=1 Tax=Subtercola sp. Z020 TaxID=2080582 RepID=UPI000CE9055B|nr:hypothetical protein [Subtercola sp. Z020]PPF88278.1 hypothetical protein C5B96_02810 [Subtercola sp. Z020]